MAEEQKPDVREWRRFARLKPNSKSISKRARKIEKTTLRHAHRFIVKRWDNAQDVRRHIVGWLALVVLLIAAALLQGGWWYPAAYSAKAPARGMTYAEGVIGQLDSINPLFAQTPSELSASRLIFSGLFDYDSAGQLRGDLATSWQAVDNGKAFLVKLRPDLKWQDGAPLNADDVVFTVGLMQDQRVKSNYYKSWSNIDVSKVDDTTVRFDLPGSYAPFPSALTFGILPKHLLQDVSPDNLRESDFARHPIGSGPFMFQSKQVIDANNDRLVLQLAANPYYYRGQPRLKGFQLHIYGDVDQLKQGYLSGQVNAISAAQLSSADLVKLGKLRQDSVQTHAGLNDGVFALFNIDSPNLSNRNIRAALLSATNRPAIVDSLNGNAEYLNGPLLPNQYKSKNNSHQAPYDQKAALAAFAKAGWKLNSNHLLKKGQANFSLNLVAPNSGDYPVVANQVAKDWRAVGVDVSVDLVDPKTIVQNVLSPRGYDVLIYELSLGSDPDQFAYWDSSQANPDGLNLSNYQSDIADEALETARAKLDPVVRSDKYNVFVTQWHKDVPAIALYRPTLHYLSTRNTTTISQDGTVVSQPDRYRNVIYWSVGKHDVFTTP
ncbi:MAG TPA: peptide ABC transporter substrate-binding protein [Candidatus Saccharimonadales bacterium]|nr:peptide ABC transporter substrate-binding protein [Candidatus Saccharimonadales bacterium]